MFRLTKSNRTKQRLLALGQSDLRWHIRECYAWWYAKRQNLHGNKGGWICNMHGRALAQGWTTFYMKYRIRILDAFWQPDVTKEQGF